MANQPRLNFPNAGHHYKNIVKPVEIELAFTVDPSNANGLGVSSLKSNGYIQNVFMQTSETPGENNGQLNPNPADGLALIFLRNNFNVFLGASAVITSVSQTSTKIDNSALVVGNPYVISTLGNASLATWQAVGVPPGVTPAVGVPFIAIDDGGTANTSTSRVMIPKPSGIQCIEIFGQPALTSNNNVYANSGQYLLVQFLAPTIDTGAMKTPMIATAPEALSVVNMKLRFDGSSSSVDGL